MDRHTVVTYHISSMQEAQLVSIETGNCAVFSHASTNKPEDNQDSAAIINMDQSESVLVLSDGAGGHPSGDLASKIVIDEISKELLDHANQDQLIRASVLNAIEEANKLIIDTSSGAGATVCVVSIEKNTIRPFHIGDSVIAIVGQRGKLIYRNTEHSPLGYAIRSELFSEEHLGTKVSHEVFNLIGNDEMHIEIGPEIRLKKNDTIFICSDGITDIIPFEECLNIIKAGTLKKAAKKLIEKYFNLIQDMDHKDDATFIIFRKT